MPNATVPHGVVSTHAWACDLYPEKPEQRGWYLRLVRRLTIAEVFDSLHDELGLTRDEWGMKELPPGIDEYFVISSSVDAARDWPDGRMLAYAVTGGSEGHYVHVDVNPLDGTGTLKTLFLGKTFAGWDAAWEAAKLIGQALGV